MTVLGMSALWEFVQRLESPVSASNKSSPVRTEEAVHQGGVLRALGGEAVLSPAQGLVSLTSRNGPSGKVGRFTCQNCYTVEYFEAQNGGPVGG
mgnify:CR=1